jgi:hypothetical protein
MPVGTLFVEGMAKAPEQTVLRQIVPTGCVVTPGGSKTGLADQVRGVRRARGLGGGVVAALRDRDFDQDSSAPQGAPRTWVAGRAKDWIGWTWERVEIENYLIDPVVVAAALGQRAPDPAKYERALDDAAQRIAAYTAARTALSLWPLYAPMANRWGDAVFGGDHRFPSDRSPEACRAAIRQVVVTYETKRRVEVDDVLERFEQLHAECQPGGIRFAHCLTFFSGKDLVLAIEPELGALGLGGPKNFCKQVASKVELATDDVATWVPEWSALRRAMEHVETNDAP